MKYVEISRTPVALAIISEKMRELKADGRAGAIELYGKGVVAQDKIIEGVVYELRYAAVLPGSVPDLRKASAAQLALAAPPGKELHAVQIVGYVNCMVLYPFTNIKMGPLFELTFRRE
jgi:hypothetical protein